MNRFLMCPPDYYGIEYEINPWMDLRRKADPKRARAQWEGLYELLIQRLGVAVELIDPVGGLPDMVFTANAGLVVGKRFIVANLRHPERQGESRYFREWFQARGYEMLDLPRDHVFEGEGDGLFFQDSLFAGYQTRSDIGAHENISQLISKRVLSLELVDPRFYHLDTCFCPLDHQRALYYPKAFDAYGRSVIEHYVPRPLAVEDADALRFGCNAIVVGHGVVLSEGCEGLKRLLQGEGFEVHEINLTEYHKAGGSVKCLALKLA